MTVPDAYLHAYVNNELTLEEFASVAPLILNSDEHFIRVGNLLPLKHLIRQAYKTIPVTDNE
jgi:hypothetical protein